ncbi:MAG: hypothetical protein E7773_08995 [Sphingomonas sp.]|uniref:hypothetical protein n=1 Tax=Sphingomonas sp. TaxID=28214 RepID=UPI001210BC4C|nr:hypothetical protein [Sphingomonas sp.]THD36061.1 MAG: hypothetical protein E7773_08995 [Sphingomonas sp.]
MTAHFTVAADPARDLVRIKMSGFFTPADIDAFYAARAAEHAKLTCGRNQHLTLNDLRDMKVQAQDVVAAFQSLLADPAYRSRRLAFVVSRTLARSQLMRALDRRVARCFEDAREAEAWLLAPDADTIAA